MMGLIRKAQSLFEKVVHTIEEHPAPLSRYILLFFAILSIRLTLEFFSSQRLFTVADVVHIGLWFLFIVMAFLVQLHLFSGENIRKVIRLVVVCFTLALSAPILDLLITGGVGAKMNYLSINSFRDVAWSYITVGGSSLSRGATLGIRIEIVLLMIASWNYVRTKTGSHLWGVLGGVCIYTVLFTSGALPWLLNLLNTVWDARPPEVGVAGSPPGGASSLSLFLLNLDLILLLIICMRYAPARLLGWLRAAPRAGVGVTVALFAAGAWMGPHYYPDNWMLNQAAVFTFPILIAVCFCMLVHHILYREGEKALHMRHGLMLFSMCMTAIVSYKLLFLLCAFWGLGFLLREAPLYLYKAPLLRNLLEGMQLATIALAGFVSFGGVMVGFPAPVLLGIVGMGLLMSLVWERMNPNTAADSSQISH